MAAADVERVNRDDIPATIHYISKISGIPLEDFFPLGSTGKKADSGDIDLGVDANKHSAEDVHVNLCAELGEDKCKHFSGLKMSSYAIPIAGDPSKGLVQVDLMFSKNPEWLKFSYHSPGEQSKYKGAIRALLLMGVASTYEEQGTDHYEYNPETGELMIRAGRTLDMNKGLRRIFQYRPMSKKGDRYLKTLKTISVEEFKQMFPDIEVHGDEVTIDDPRKVLTMLFGKNVRPRDVNTAEDVIDLIKKTFNEEEQIRIFKKTANRARSVAKKMNIPPEIAEYINEASNV